MSNKETKHNLNFYIYQAEIHVSKAEAALWDKRDVYQADNHATAALELLDYARDIVDSNDEISFYSHDSETRQLCREIDELETTIFEEFKEASQIVDKVHKATTNIHIFIAKASHDGYTHNDCLKCFEVATEACEYLHELHIEGLLPNNVDLTAIDNDYWVAFDKYAAKV